MEYSKIVAITGLPGLFELISSKTDGAIVRSLEDKTTRFVSSRVHNFSHLESIEVYTVRDNVNLTEVLQAMEKSSEALPDEKDAAALQNYFKKVFRDLDFDRVYSSDLKKMVKWFAVLKSNHIPFELSSPPEEQEAEEKEPEEKTPLKQSAPEAKPAPAARKVAEPAPAAPSAKETKKKTSEPKKEKPKESKGEKKTAAPKKPADKKSAAKKKGK